jgi:hypothetical protein
MRIHIGKGGEPAEMFGRRLGSLGHNRHIQPAADQGGDVLEQHTLLGNRVITVAAGPPFNGKPVDGSRIQPVHRGPAVEPFADIGRHALFAREVDEVRYEAMVAVTMNRRRKTDHRRAHSLRRERRSGRFRNAGHSRGSRAGQVFFRRRAIPSQMRHSRGDEQGAIRAFEHSAKRLDGAAVHLAVLREFREIMIECSVDHPICGSSAIAQAWQIVEIAAMRLRAENGKRFRRRVRADKTKHLMARLDEFLHDGRADKACGTGNEDTHSASPFKMK